MKKKRKKPNQQTNTTPNQQTKDIHKIPWKFEQQQI